jgi:Ca2+-binding EF-hand superfamily protein
MLLAAIVLPLLAAAAPDASRPITVTGHVWAPFISPMGEPFRPHGAGDDTLADWFNQADRNHDGFLTIDEMQSDADRFFAVLDVDRNGEIDPDELVHYEWEVAPDIQVMAKTRRPAGAAPIAEERSSEAPPNRGSARQRRAEQFDSELGIGTALQGAARYSLLSIPEPVAAADADFNRGVTLAEFREAARTRFALLDKKREGRLTLAGLEALLPALPEQGKKAKRDFDARDTRIGQPLPPGN